MNSRDLTAAVLIVLGVLVLLPGVGMVLWGSGTMGPGMMGPEMIGPGMMGPGMMGRGAWGAGFWMQGLLVLAIGIALILLGAARRRPTVDESLQALKQRLARGEITRDQYEELKQAVQ